MITVNNGVDLGLFTLIRSLWGMLFVMLAAWCWGCCTFPKKVRNQSRLANWQARFWYLGLMLSTIGYFCLWPGWQNILRENADIWWRLSWLIIPAIATLVARRSSKVSRKRQATIVSCGGLILGQLLILGRPEIRLIALSMGLWLMYVNAFHLRRRTVTIIHIGFGLGIIASLFSSFMSQNLINNWHWLSIMSLTLLGLYRLQIRLIKSYQNPRFDYISQRMAHGILGVGVETANFKLIAHYVQAIDFWAISIIVGQLFALVSIFLFQWANSSGYLACVITIIILPVALIWRYGQTSKG